MVACVRKVVVVDGETAIILVEPAEPTCWIDPDSVTGRPALIFSHDCASNGVMNDRFRSEGPLRTDKYPCFNADYPEWQIVSENPLTVSPSIQCMAKDCNTHGFWREDKWVKA